MPTATDEKVLKKKTPAVKWVVAPPRAAVMAPPSGWLWPTRSTRITQGPQPGHVAYDIGSLVRGRIGDPVYAPVGSTVARVSWQEEGYGLNVRLLTPEGLEIILGHLAATAPGLAAGQTVTRGQLVGLLGSTGNSSGPHLHYEIREPGPDVFRPGESSTSSAVNPGRFYPTRVLPAASNRIGQPLSSFSFAPTVARDAVIQAPYNLSSLASRARSLAGFAEGEPAPGGDRAGREAPRPPYPGIPSGAAMAAARAPAAGDVRIASTPLGDVTIPRPPLRQWIPFGIGALLVVGSVLYMLRRPVMAVAGPIANAAVGAVPEARAARGVLRRIKR